jgi:hypothetical protein
MPGPFAQLIYRGNFQLTAGIDYGGALLSAKFPNGYRRTAVVGVPLRDWKLTYSALHRRVKVQLPNGESMSRLDYVWAMYCSSKGSGNYPFVLRCARDGKLYLAVFTDDRLEYSLIDQFLATSGLAIEQAAVRGVTTNADGSLDEGITYP